MSVPPAKPRILVVEDEVIVARDIQSQLTTLGYEIAGHARRGEEAVTLALETHPDLVLMDIQLAGAMDGISAAQAIRARLGLPVVFLTAFAQDDTLERAKLTEPFGYILKPFSERELRTVLEMALYKHQSERKLRLSEENLAITLRSIGDAVLTTDALGRIARINTVAEHLTGWTQDEAAGRPVDEVFRIINEETREPQVSPVPDTLAKGTVHELANHTALLARDGTERPIADSCAPIRGADNTIVGAVLVFRDVSREYAARRALEAGEKALREANESLERIVTERTEALRSSEARYRAMAEWSPEPFMIHREGKIVYVNPAAVKMFGATSTAQLLGTPSLDRVHPDSRPSVLERITQMRREGTDVPMVEHKYLRLDGTILPVEAQATPILFDNSLAIHVALRDITERMRAEASRAELEAQLRESQKMQAIGTLAGGIAHDFNNIISIIFGNIDLALMDVGGNAAAVESLNEIRRASTRARDLVQQILSFSRREATLRKPTQLAAVVQESVRLLRATLPARVALEMDCAADVPDVLADKTQIEQVLINLATNAMQAMHGKTGRIDIRLDTATLDAGTARSNPYTAAMRARGAECVVRLTVQDDGAGMDAVTLARIFEPFFTTKPVGEGTGLGLSVVHGIVQAHEGAIIVDSTPGKGTVFTLFLPYAPAVLDSATDGVQASSAPPLTHIHGKHLLYIDDDEALLFVVKRLMTRHGVRMSAFSNQAKAFEALRADPASFDLVLTDYNMPQMSGLDVARAVRAIRTDLPVAVASGFIDETLRKQAAASGVHEVIFKANAIEDFCAAIERLLAPVG